MKNLSVLTFALIIVTSLVFLSCNKPDSGTQNPLIAQLDNIQKEFVPDRRIEVFNVTIDDDSNIITVETTSTPAAEAVRLISDDIIIKMLPDIELGEYTNALVRVSVAHLRRDPRHQAELIDQAIMGTELKVLKKRGGWYYIQTPWEYLGWVTSGSLELMSDETLESRWQSKNHMKVATVDTRIFRQPRISNDVLSDVTLGAILVVDRNEGMFTKVTLPDSRQGYILSNELTELNVIDNSKRPDGDSIIQTAKSFHGLPYIWGGNSGKGFDCSGFTQTVFKANGYLLPRDANMQVMIGTEIPIEGDFSHVLPGDLLFFGPSESRITHVGISLGGARYIHSSSYVQINSLNESDDDFDLDRRETIQFIKRI